MNLDFSDYFPSSVETYLFFFSSRPHSSLQVKSVQTQSHCWSVTDGSDAILFSRRSEWRGWRRQLSSGSVLSRTRARDISASLFGLVVGNIRYAQMGKGGESSISDSDIISFRLWSAANRSILSAPWNNMWQSTHTGTTCTNNLKNTIQVTAKECAAFAIRKGTNGCFLSPENVRYWCKTIYLPRWYTVILQQLNKKCGSLGFNICTNCLVF